MPKLDAETKAVLRDLKAIEPLTKGDPDISVVREAYDKGFAGWTAPADRPTNERWVGDCQLGGSHQALVIEPTHQEPGDTSLVIIHGGGWSLGNALCYAPLGRWLCGQTGMRVLVPDFPQAPEQPAPAAYEALLAFIAWVQASYGGAISLIGDSAGGNLAAVISNHPPEGVTIKAQALLYPVIDLRPDATYKSRRKYGRGNHFLTSDGIVGAAMQYCGELQLPKSPLLTPLLETDFSKTPPTVIMIPEFDPLYDECIAYGDLLKANGIETQIEIATGTIHGCASFGGRIPSGRRVLQSVCKLLFQF